MWLARPHRAVIADLHTHVRLRSGKRLHVGVDRDKIDEALGAGDGDHAVERVSIATAHANHLDRARRHSGRRLLRSRSLLCWRRGLGVADLLGGGLCDLELRRE